MSNFAVGVAVARVAGAAALGEYSLAYAAWLIVAGLHRSLVTDPMAIENDLNQSDATFHVRVGLAAELTFGLVTVVAFGLLGLVLCGIGQHAFGIAFMSFAPWLPFLVAQDYWRWVAFMEAKPIRAIANDGVFDFFQVVAFVFLFFAGERSSVLAIVAWGLGAFAGSVYGLQQFAIRPTLRGGLRRLKSRWNLSKWLVATSSASTGSDQAVTVLSAAILGPVGVGALRAARTLVSGPSMVLIQAGGSIGLPEAARALNAHGWPGLRRVQRFVTLAGVVSVGPIAVVVLAFSKQLLAAIYGHQFARYALSADLLALTFFVETFGLGAVLSLKSIKQTRLLYRLSVVSLLASLGLTAVLAPLFGVLGAAEAQLGSIAILSVARLVVHWRYSRPAAERSYAGLQPSPDEGREELPEAHVVVRHNSARVAPRLKGHDAVIRVSDPLWLTPAEVDLLQLFVRDI